MTLTEDIMAYQRVINNLCVMRHNWEKYPALQKQLDEAIVHATVKIHQLRFPKHYLPSETEVTADDDTSTDGT